LFYPTSAKLVKSLNFVDVIMLGIAAMIGVAIFVLTSPAIGLGGSAVIFACNLNASVTLFTALGYAELVQLFQNLVGLYIWVREEISCIIRNSMPHQHGND
jgi:basic amino acid/polyamine antiporter, APA family